MRVSRRGVLRLRRVRKIPAALSLLVLAGGSLVACSSAAPVASCERPASSDSLASIVSVGGAEGAPPELTVDMPFSTDRTIFADVEEGDGEAIADPDQPASLEFAFYTPDTGDLIVATPYDGDLSAPQAPSNWFAQFPGLEDALTCATVGTRILVGIDEDGVPEATRQQYAMQGFPQDGPVLAVVDVNAAYPKAAWGSSQYNAGTNLPSVVRAPDGRPGITVPDEEAPDDLVVQTLLKGDGETVGADDSAVLRYTGVIWDTGEVFDSSWDSGRALVTGGGLIEGFQAAVEGQTVGSQVMAVIPPDLGYGEAGSPPDIPANATLVFVVDIVAIQD